MRSTQKKIKFSKGQITPELVERTDLELYNSSAQEITNLISTVYGGVRTRRGTRYVSDIYSSTTTGTVTNNIGGTDSYIQDLTNPFESNNLGSTRELMSIDYGSVIVGGSLTVKNLKTSLLAIMQSTSDTSFTIPSEDEFRIALVGGGGAAAMRGVYDDKGYGWGGGSGGAFVGNITIPAGTYNVVVGTANNNAIPQTSNTQTSNPADTTTHDSYIEGIVRVGGGGSGHYNANYVGAAGAAPEFTIQPNSYEVNRGGNAGLYNAGGKGSSPAAVCAGGASVYEGYGQGQGCKTSEYRTARSWINGTGGYAEVALAKAVIEVQTSTDGVTYETKATYNIGTSPEDIKVQLSGFRYVRLVLDADAGLDLQGKLSFDYIRVNSNISGKVKLIPYIFNNEQEYVIAISKEKINIFEDGSFAQEITASAILEDYIDDLKYTAKDDTIIFTHKDMPPQELKRTNSGFVLSAFNLVNIPMYAFGGETKTSQSTSITPSGLEGAIKITAASSIFDSSWVGQRIDGNGGLFRITEVTSGTVVKGVTIIPFYTTDAITSWTKISGYEEVWSNTRGYPRTCLFAQQRLWFGGSRDLPAHLWGSRLNDYNNFKNSANYDNDAIDVTLLTNNPILNLVEQRGIHIFTSGEEWSANESNLVPDLFSVTKNTANGSLSIDPVIIGGIVMYVEKNGKSILGYVYNYEQASFVSDNLSIFSNLVQAPKDMDAEINSNIDRGDFLFIVLEDGTMLTACVAVAERIFSISKFVTDGNIKSVCCLTSDTYLAVERSGGLYLERLSDDKTDQSQTFYVNGQTVYNMEEYNDKYIYVSYGDKLDKLYVTNGQMTLPESYTGYATAGLAFDYKLQSNPIAIENRTFTCKKRISKATLACKNTEKLTFCGQTKKNDYTFYACTQYKDDVRFEITGEYNPIEVLSVTLDINYEG